MSAAAPPQPIPNLMSSVRPIPIRKFPAQSPTVRSLLLRLLLPLFLLPLSGCGDGGMRVDDDLIDAYAEVLIADALYPADSAAWAAALDEKLDDNRFDSPSAVHEAIRDLALNDARAFTTVMDSVQIRLDRIRAGTDE